MSRFDSTEQWLEIMEKSGLSREERKEQIRLELLFQAYEEEVLAPKIEEELLTPEKVREYYDKYEEELFQRPRRIHVLHLMRAVPRDAPEQERSREREIIEEARARVERGEAFEDVAREISSDESAIEGGDIGWVTEETRLPKDLKKAILELSEGEMTGVLESPHGLHVFKAKEVQEAGTVPFEEVKEDIRARMKREAMKNRMAEHVSQLREQLIQAGKLQYLNLTPHLGRSLTPKEAQQAQQQGQPQQQGEAGQATAP
jgi:peptidyl-prolyl cis-trans isomerase D